MQIVVFGNFKKIVLWDPVLGGPCERKLNTWIILCQESVAVNSLSIDPFTHPSIHLAYVIIYLPCLVSFSLYLSRYLSLSISLSLSSLSPFFPLSLFLYFSLSLSLHPLTLSLVLPHSLSLLSPFFFPYFSLSLSLSLSLLSISSFLFVHYRSLIASSAFTFSVHPPTYIYKSIHPSFYHSQKIYE